LKDDDVESTSAGEDQKQKKNGEKRFGVGEEKFENSKKGAISLVEISVHSENSISFNFPERILHLLICDIERKGGRILSLKARNLSLNLSLPFRWWTAIAPKTT